MNWIVLLIAVGLVGFGVLAMMIGQLLSRRKKFPEFRVGHNAEMRKKKIYCYKTEQKIIDLQTCRSHRNSMGCTCGQGHDH